MTPDLHVGSADVELDIKFNFWWHLKYVSLQTVLQCLNFLRLHGHLLWFNKKSSGSEECIAGCYSISGLWPDVHQTVRMHQSQDHHKLYQHTRKSTMEETNCSRRDVAASEKSWKYFKTSILESKGKLFYIFNLSNKQISKYVRQAGEIINIKTFKADAVHCEVPNIPHSVYFGEYVLNNT